jgi:hypothetical protein
MKTFSLLIIFLLLLSGCDMKRDPAVLQPILEDAIKNHTTVETGLVTVNNFKVTGSEDSEKAIEGSWATVTATAFTCDFRLEEDTYWNCGAIDTFNTDVLNGKGLDGLSCFKKVVNGLSDQSGTTIIPKGTILPAAGEILFIDFEKRIRPSRTIIKLKFVSGK